MERLFDDAGVNYDVRIGTTTIFDELDYLAEEVNRISKRYDIRPTEIIMRLMDRMRGIRP